MPEILIHLQDKPKFSECLRTHEVFAKDQNIFIDDNITDEFDTGASLHVCRLKNRRIPRFLYEEFKNRQVVMLSIDNEFDAVYIHLYA